MRVSDLFDPEPETWGLRGDPHLWRALRARLTDQDLPASTGPRLLGVPRAVRHSGMSSGMISLETWRQRLMPMLFERASGRPPRRP
jgi:hypothetical protein